ncbi:MAG TPA: NAD-binding protein [Rhodopila sp.]|nr:NAD-binding protein [Rhodopila sp.]
MLIVMAAAVGCYVWVGWPVGDALYMVVITVYTVGFAEVLPVNTPLLRGITIGTIVLGCTGMIYLTGTIVQVFTLNQLNRVLGSRRMTTQIDRLRDHIIICGFGRTGAMLARDLMAGGVSLVVIEQSEAGAEVARGQGFLCLHADATNEDTLLSAGVERARALTTVLSNDAANVFITLSARSLNPKLEIIARGEVPSTERKLLQAGANKVVLPAHTGAERIAEMLLYEETAHFIRGSERMRDFEKVLQLLGLDIDIVAAAPGSPVVGQTIGKVEHYANGAFFIVQINRRAGPAITRPAGDLVIEAGDGIVLVGRGSQTRALASLFESGGHSPFTAS